MSAILINGGTFEEIGDLYMLELSPVTNVIQFIATTDITTNETATRTFLKHFKYSVNGGVPTAWIVLDDTNLQAIVVNPTDVYRFWIRYIRDGADGTQVLIWNVFELDALVVDPPCVVLRTNKANWDALYNGPEKFIEVSEQVERFNQDWSIPHFNINTYLVDDPTVADTNIIVRLLPNAPCLATDINVLLKKLWGNYLVDYQFKIDVDLYDGVPQ